jgi:hypothetical protein
MSWHCGLRVGCTTDMQACMTFMWILIHTGNVASHTDGCILVGKTVNSPHTEEGRVERSREAYREVAPVITQWLLDGYKVTLTITDMDI